MTCSKERLEMSGGGEEEDTDPLSLSHILHTQNISDIQMPPVKIKYKYVYIKPLHKLNIIIRFLIQRMGVWYFKNLPTSQVKLIWV